MAYQRLEIEILQYNYWEHFKAAKDLALVLPIDHPKRIALQKTIDELILQINSNNTHIQ